jgi:hypothetical protein
LHGQCDADRAPLRSPNESIEYARYDTVLEECVI